MSALGVRRQLRRHRRRFAVIAAVLALAGLIAAHHSSGGLLDLHHDPGSGAIIELCLGVLTAAGAAVAVAGLLVALGWRLTLTLLPSCVLRALRVPVARARDGPHKVFVLCVSRR